MSRLPAAARRLGERLDALGRARVSLAEIRRAFQEAAPDAVGAPDQRERLAAALSELAVAGRIRPPTGPRSWDRSAEPPLPRSVRLLRDSPAPGPAPPSAASFPWRPELAFAGDLRLSENGFLALKRVNEWLRDRPESARTVPARERSLEVFGDEKAIDRLSRRSLFGPGRLTFTLLACEPLSPPFVWNRTGAGGTLLVVENHHTFHTLARVLAERDTEVGVVAYGAGEAFVRSVTHALALPRPVRRILYFGDLDAPGLRIPIRAGRKAEGAGLPPVEPAPNLYELLLKTGRPAPYRSSPTEEEVTELVRWLPERLRVPATDVLLAGLRIAQEWVGLDALLSNPPPLP